MIIIELVAVLYMLYVFLNETAGFDIRINYKKFETWMKYYNEKNTNLRKGIIYLTDLKKWSDILTDITQVPPDTCIKLIISVKENDLTNCEKIVKTLKNHKTGYTAYILGDCRDTGSIIAMGAKSIVMGQ